ncbi:GntR family transcriptional regulator [Luteipulveratus halotolerans]|uniref:GntR family transcriptional regulator n=1 Tax=Luteipulveratus halotolerans TaxID=1631356 RepID=A0A0L6CJF1_9MICO|nr:GntR family transcriptional regulator [Luteipulveratus halotolerans]KNX37922.1 GntR family transcriptional regulator [Luteipulveratus halotolerans]
MPPSPTQSAPWISTLADDRSSIGRSSTAARVADVLRSRVIEGLLSPGTRLSEEEIGEALGVSRNTLREAFRLLTHERLLEHQFNRGVFVRSLTSDDIRDLYQLRRMLECGALRYAAAADGVDLTAVRAAVADGEQAGEAQDWPAVGTANMHFHQAIGALARSARIDESMQHLLAELRLVFHVMNDPHAFHQPYLVENRALLDLLDAGRYDDAVDELSAYLDRAEQQLLDAMA